MSIETTNTMKRRMVMQIDDSGDGVLHEGEIVAQRRFGVVREGKAMSRIIRDRLTPGLAKFIEAQPFFFIATANHHGECDCSFRGRQHNAPGDPDPAIKVMDETTLVFPDYAGNNLYNSLGNIIVNPNIGLLFINFQNTARVRVNGRAGIIEDPEAFRDIWPDALRCVRVDILQAYPNCRNRIPAMAMAEGGATRRIP